MLILNKLLFQPMLKFMDERNERIARAKEKEQELHRSKQEYEEKLKVALEQHDKEEAQRVEQVLADAKANASDALHDAENDLNQAIELTKEKIKSEDKEMSDHLEANIDKIADAFLSRLVS